MAVVGRKQNEQEVAIRAQEILSRRLSKDYVVHVGKSILYKIGVDAQGKVIPDSVDSPMRGQYAFQTDILVESRSPSIPLVVVELKYGSFSSHDVITYSWKASQHKGIYPYLRYGFVVVGLGGLGRRFLTHNQSFDFALALPDIVEAEAEFVAVVQRQVASAECLAKLMRSNQIKLLRYEENVEIAS